MSQLAVRVATIRKALEHEGDYAPGWVLAYGRPHQTGRSRLHPRFTRTGVRITGSVRVPPDCPAPVKGRCECRPDGSWRPVGGSLQADASAHNAVFARTSEVREDDGRYPGVWTDALYVKGPDGLWRCTRPHRRAMELLRDRYLRRYLVLDRLIAGDRVDHAWSGLGRPKNLVRASLDICDEVDAMAREESLAEYERRPREWRGVAWVDRSESQQNADGGAVAIA